MEGWTDGATGFSRSEEQSRAEQNRAAEKSRAEKNRGLPAGPDEAPLLGDRNESWVYVERPKANANGGGRKRG